MTVTINPVVSGYPLQVLSGIETVTSSIGSMALNPLMVGRYQPSTLLSPTIFQIAPLFFDPADSTNTTMTGRTGWTRAGDATKGDKMKSADDIFRMNTGTNGGTPFGYQLTAAPSQYRRISFGYDYSQQGGTLTNAATPYQFHDQQWILAWTDSSNYTYAHPTSISAGTMQLRIHKVVAGVDTELTCRFLGVPWAGNAVIELTDRVRLYVDDTLYVADGLFNAVTTAFPDRLFPVGSPAIRTGSTGFRHVFHPLILAKDWKVESLEPMWCADPMHFYGRNTATNSRVITFTGTYSGVPVSWAYRLRSKDSGSTVKDWATFSPTFGSGTFSGDIDIATGGPYLIDIGWTGADGDTRVFTPLHFAVGPLYIGYGQSNAVNMSGLGGNGAGYGGNSLIIGFNGNAAYVGSTWRRWMDELSPQSLVLQPNMVGLSKSLSDITDLPTGVAAMGFASNALVTLKPGTANFTAFQAFVAEIGGYYEGVIWSQGEAEALASSDHTNYVTDFASLVAGFESTSENSNIKVYVRIVGKDASVANNSTTTARAVAMRAKLNNLADGTTVFIATHSVGIELLGDGLHFASAGSTKWTYLTGLSIAKSNGLIAYDGRGPLVTSATLSVATITLGVDLNGTSGISGTALTGYEVSNDDFATLLPISTAEVVANEIVLVLSGVPTGTVKVRSFAPAAYVETSLASGTLPDGVTTVAVFPILTPITVT